MPKKTRKTAEWIYLDLAWTGEDAGTTFIERHIA
jgi:hypothetical protein